MPFGNDRSIHAAPWGNATAPQHMQTMITAENESEPPEDDVQQTRKRAIPLKKRKRLQPRACSPNESIEASTTQTYGSQFQESNALQIQMPAHFSYNPESAVERNCPSSETVPSVSTNSAVAAAAGAPTSEQGNEARERSKPSRQEPSDDSSQSGDSADYREGLPSRIASSSSSTDQSSCRTEFFKKRGRKLPKALRHAVAQENFSDRKPSPVPNLPLGSSCGPSQSHFNQSVSSQATHENLHAADPGCEGESSYDLNESGHLSSNSSGADPYTKKPSKTLKKQWAAAAAAASDVLDRSRGNTPTYMDTQDHYPNRSVGPRETTNFFKDSSSTDFEVRPKEAKRRRVGAEDSYAPDESGASGTQRSKPSSAAEVHRDISSQNLNDEEPCDKIIPRESSDHFDGHNQQFVEGAAERKRCDAFAPVGSQSWDQSGRQHGPSVQSATGWFKPGNKASNNTDSASAEHRAGLSKNRSPRLVSEDSEVGARKSGLSSASHASIQQPSKSVHAGAGESSSSFARDTSTFDEAEKVDASHARLVSKQERLKKKKRKKKREKALRELAEQQRRENKDRDNGEQQQEAPQIASQPVEVNQAVESTDVIARNKNSNSPAHSSEKGVDSNRTAVVGLDDEPPNAFHRGGEREEEQHDNDHADKADDYSDSDSILQPAGSDHGEGGKPSKRATESEAPEKKSTLPNQLKDVPEKISLGGPQKSESSRASIGSSATVRETAASDSEEEESDEEEQLWIQCDRCKKWRIIPSNMNGWLPRIWRCEENIWDLERNSCSVPQQELEEDEYHIGKDLKKKKSNQKTTKKPATKQTNGNTIRRPRGRPPLGKVWDPIRGMYVPEEEYQEAVDSSEKMPKEPSPMALSPKPASSDSSENAKKSKKRKNDATNSPGLEPEQAPKPKKKKKKGRRRSGSSSEMKRSKKKQFDGNRDKKQMEKLLEIGRREAKAELEREKNKVMCRLPSDVKNLFGQVGFAKWGREALPALALSPYKVPPGAARDAWMNMFKRLKKSGHLDEISILVHWYGEQDPDNLFSLLDINKFIPYSEASPDVRNYAKTARQKQKLQKKLTKGDLQRLRAMEELKADLAKAPVDRQPVSFKERDELLTLEDVEEFLDEESDESDDDEEESVASVRPPPPPPPVEKKASADDGYSTLEDSEDDLEDDGVVDSPDSGKKRVEQKKGTAQKSTEQSTSSSMEPVALPPTAEKLKSVKKENAELESVERVAERRSESLAADKPEKPFSGDIVSMPPSENKATPSPTPQSAEETNFNSASLVSELGIDCPSSQDLGGVRVDDLVQTVFVNAKGRAEGSALMGTVMHVVNRLREQRDAALKQCAALQVERANLLARLDSSTAASGDGPKDLQASVSTELTAASDHVVNFKPLKKKKKKKNKSL